MNVRIGHTKKPMSAKQKAALAKAIAASAAKRRGTGKPDAPSKRRSKLVVELRTAGDKSRAARTADPKRDAIQRDMGLGDRRKTKRGNASRTMAERADAIRNAKPVTKKKTNLSSKNTDAMRDSRMAQKPKPHPLETAAGTKPYMLKKKIAEAKPGSVRNQLIAELNKIRKDYWAGNSEMKPPSSTTGSSKAPGGSSKPIGDRPDPGTMSASAIVKERKELLAKKREGELSKEEAARLVAIQAESSLRGKNRKEGKGGGPTKIALGEKKAAPKNASTPKAKMSAKEAEGYRKDVVNIYGSIHNTGQAAKITVDDQGNIEIDFSKTDMAGNYLRPQRIANALARKGYGDVRLDGDKITAKIGGKPTDPVNPFSDKATPKAPSSPKAGNTAKGTDLKRGDVVNLPGGKGEYVVVSNDGKTIIAEKRGQMKVSHVRFDANRSFEKVGENGKIRTSAGSSYGMPSKPSTKANDAGSTKKKLASSIQPGDVFRRYDGDREVVSVERQPNGKYKFITKMKGSQGTGSFTADRNEQLDVITASTKANDANSAKPPVKLKWDNNHTNYTGDWKSTDGRYQIKQQFEPKLPGRKSGKPIGWELTYNSESLGMANSFAEAKKFAESHNQDPAGFSMPQAPKKLDSAKKPPSSYSDNTTLGQLDRESRKEVADIRRELQNISNKWINRPNVSTALNNANTIGEMIDAAQDVEWYLHEHDASLKTQPIDQFNKLFERLKKYSDRYRQKSTAGVSQPPLRRNQTGHNPRAGVFGADKWGRRPGGR